MNCSPPEYDKRHREPVDEQHRGVRGEGTGDVRGEARPPHGRPRSPVGFRARGHLRHSSDDGVHVQGEITELAKVSLNRYVISSCFEWS